MVVWITLAALAAYLWIFGPRGLTYLVLLRVSVLALLAVLLGP